MKFTLALALLLASANTLQIENEELDEQFIEEDDYLEIPEEENSLIEEEPSTIACFQHKARRFCAQGNKVGWCNK